ncbi:MAG: hypothetical protein ACRDP4_08400, partial [Nocardioidaceae bacterium]
AGASSPPTVRPDFPMRTLTIRGVDAAGKKANVAVHLYNVDDLRKYQETVQVHHGLAKASVPVGHYAAWAFFWDSGAHTLHEVMVPQFTVRADRAIRLDARDATSRVSMQTPKPADPAINAIGVGRTDSTGETAVWTFNGTGALTFYTQPVRHGVSVGQLHYYAYSRLYSPESAGSAYTYDLMFPSDGTIAADQHYVVHEADLASVDAQYPATHTGQTGEDSRFGVLPWQAYGTTRPEPIDTPTQRTEYYSAHPDVSWEASYWQVYRSSPYTIQGLYMSAWHTYQPGTRAATAWGDQPQHPQMLQGPLFVGETICPACIGGSTLHLLVYPYGGNSPWHRGSSSGSDTGLDQSISYAVYADDVPVEESQGMVDTTVTAPADARRYRIDYHVHRASAEFTQSTDVRTRWTVRAAARRGDLSPGWSCTLAQSTDCKVLALMTSDYRLPVDMLGRVRSGKATGEVRIGHLRGLAGIGVTSLKVRVTFDSGDHWRRVQVDRRAPGRYGIAFKVPKAGRTNGFGGLRIRARDAAGGTLRQTIQHAFSVVAR